MAGRWARLSVLATLLGLAVVGSGCGAAAAPSVRVLGVEPQRAVDSSKLLLFVEVVNPGGRDITLSRLDYHVHAATWFESRGEVTLTRHIGAGSSAVIEIRVPVEDRNRDANQPKIPYVLEGRLFAREDQVERSWDVEVKGALGAEQASNGARVTLAGL